MPNVTERAARWLYGWNWGASWEGADDETRERYLGYATEILSLIQAQGEVEYVRADLQRPTPEPVVWRFKRPDGRWEYDEGVDPPKIVGGLEAWEAKGWIFEALYNDKEVGE